MGNFRSKLSKSSNPVSHYQSPSTALVKRSMFSHNDHHYRDAIGRLKMMLADSYAPKYSSSSSIFKSVTDDETDTTENTIIERPAMKEVSKYFSYKPYSTFSNVSSYARKPSMTSQNLQIPSRTKTFALWNCFRNVFIFQWEIIRLTLCFRLGILSRRANC